MGNTHSLSRKVPRDSPLAQLLAPRYWFTTGTLKKKELIRLCREVWPSCHLEGGERWPPQGSSDPKTILQLARFCQQRGRWGEIAYVEIFTKLQPNLELLKVIRSTAPPAPQKDAELRSQDQPSAPVRRRAKPPPAPPSANSQPSPSVQQPAPPPPPASRLPPPISQQEPPPPASLPSRCPVAVNHQTPGPAPEEHRLVPRRSAPPQEASDWARHRGRFQCFSLGLSSIPNFSEDPQRFYEQFVILNKQCRLTVTEVLLILSHHCEPEDRDMIMTKAREFYVRWCQLCPDHDLSQTLWTSFPDEDPPSYRMDDLQRQRTQFHVACVAEGIRECVAKPRKYTKVLSLYQKDDEDPAEFLDRLRVALGKYSSVDPNSPEGETLLGCHMVAQSALDIRKHLQRLYKGPTTSLSTLEREAFKVFQNRAQAQAERIVKSLTWELQKALVQSDTSVPKKKPWRLDRDQCAFCKRHGHWKRNCPMLHRSRY